MTGSAGRFFEIIYRLPCIFYGFNVQPVNLVFHAIVGHGNFIGIKSIRGNDIGSGFKVLPVDILYRIRVCQRKQVVIPLLGLRMISELFSAVISLLQLQLLDHGSHRAIENQDLSFNYIF